jgi:hypothetical protein
MMNPGNSRKQKQQPHGKTGIKQVLEGILDRLREGLDELADELRPRQPEPIPIPVPVRRPGSR